MMSIRFQFPLLDTDGCRRFSFDPNDHYRLEVLSYMAFVPFLSRSMMTAGWAILTGASDDDVHLFPGLKIHVVFSFFLFSCHYYTPSSL